MSFGAYGLKNGKTVNFIDENDFIKKYRSLRMYCPRAFKYLCFEIMKNYLYSKDVGKHEVELPTDEKFKMVYGQIKLIYSTTENGVILENIVPSEILLDGYTYYLDSYKGVPYRNEKDKFKIDFLIGMRGVALWIQ